MQCWPPEIVVSMVIVMLICAMIFGASIATAYIISRYERDEEEDGDE